MRYEWRRRSIIYHSMQIRGFLGFRESSLQAAEDVSEWLCSHVLAHDQDIEHLLEIVHRRSREMRLEPPTPDQLERLFHSALHTFEDRLFTSVTQKLTPTTRAKLQQLLGKGLAPTQIAEGSDSSEPAVAVSNHNNDLGDPERVTILESWPLVYCCRGGKCRRRRRR